MSSLEIIIFELKNDGKKWSRIYFEIHRAPSEIPAKLPGQADIFALGSSNSEGVFFLIATALVANHFSLLVAWALARDWLLGRGSRLHK